MRGVLKTNKRRMGMEIKLQPLRVPNYVLGECKARLRQEGFFEGPKWHLRDVDAQTLSDLCDRFRRDVFEKAQKPDPRNVGCMEC